MLTFDTIIKELKNVPVNKLEDLYSIIQSLQTDIKSSEKKSKKILSFAGSFSDLSKKDYNDFLEQTREARKELFDRNIDL